MVGILSSLHRTFVPVGERRRQPKLKKMLVVVPKPRLYLVGNAASNFNPKRRPSNDNRMASMSSARPKHGALAVDISSQA